MQSLCFHQLTVRRDHAVHRVTSVLLIAKGPLENVVQLNALNCPVLFHAHMASKLTKMVVRHVNVYQHVQKQYATDHVIMASHMIQRVVRPAIVEKYHVLQDFVRGPARKDINLAKIAVRPVIVEGAYRVLKNLYVLYQIHRIRPVLDRVYTKIEF
ncbi:uncharacterized protein [Mytilus edulis]|uniref:uncharacterized protein n=1 Tax=Mytilus edulis TaxID=6550 RepID=UPI0039EFD673